MALKIFKRIPQGHPAHAAAPYYVRFMVRGHRHLWCTKTPEASLARKRAKEHRDAVVARNYHLVDQMKARVTGPRIEELFKEYLALPRPSEKTRKANIHAMEAVLKVSGMSKEDALSRVNGAVFVAYQNAMPTGNPITTNSVVRGARSLFSRRTRKYLKTQGMELDRDQVQDIMEVPLLEEPEKRPMIPSHDADAKALAELKGAHRRAYLLARYAGLRSKEIVAARRDWIEGTTLYVGGREFVAKSRKWRQVALPAPVVAELLAGGDLVYLAGPNAAEVAKRDMPALLKHLGFPADKPLHSVRRLFGSIVYTEQGPRQARDALGHSTQAVTDKHYARSLDVPKPVPFAG